MVKLTRNGDLSWSLCRMPDSVFYKKNYKKKRFRYTGDWLEGEKITTQEELDRISRSRTKSMIKNICLNNDFEYFGTITCSSKNCDRFSLEQTQDKIRSICRQLKKRNNEFKYIFVTEKHKDGAFHFHGMFKGFPQLNHNKSELYVNQFGYTSSVSFDKLGFNSFDRIKDYVACCHYITKYITKDFVKNDCNQMYFCSKGLKKAEFEYMIDIDLKKIFNVPEGKKSPVFSNEYCQKIDFDISKLNSEHARNLRNYFSENDLAMQNYDNHITNWLNLLTNLNNKFIIKV